MRGENYIKSEKLARYRGAGDNVVELRVGIVVSVGAAEVGPFSVTDVRVCAAEGF